MPTVTRRTGHHLSTGVWSDCVNMTVVQPYLAQPPHLHACGRVLVGLTASICTYARPSHRVIMGLRNPNRTAGGKYKQRPKESNQGTDQGLDRHCDRYRNGK